MGSAIAYLFISCFILFYFNSSDSTKPTAAETSLPWKRDSEVEMSSRARDDKRSSVDHAPPGDQMEEIDLSGKDDESKI